VEASAGPGQSSVQNPTLAQLRVVSGFRGNELGQIKAGFRADMILVDGNPLANVKILQDADKLSGHYEGRSVPQATSDRCRRPTSDRLVRERGWPALSPRLLTGDQSRLVSGQELDRLT